MIRVVVKFKSFSIMIYKTAAAIQKIVGVPTNAVLLCQCFCPEFSVRLQLINFPYPKFAAFNIGTSPQRIFNLRLRQNKSGGRFFALRSVDMFNLLGFGGDDGIQKT